MYILNFHFGYFSLLNGDSEESVRCSYCSVLNVNENDLRISFENTCTDSLVTAFDDEALLICDQGTEMARAKVLFVLVAQGSYIHTYTMYIHISEWEFERSIIEISCSIKIINILVSHDHLK